MNISRLVFLGVLGALSLVACAKTETPSETRQDVAAAANKGAENVAKAERDAANTSQEAGTDVANANLDVALVAAKAAYKVEIERCEAQTGSARTACKTNAQATLDAAQAQVVALKQ